MPPSSSPVIKSCRLTGWLPAHTSGLAMGVPALGSATMVTSVVVVVGHLPVTVKVTVYVPGVLADGSIAPVSTFIDNPPALATKVPELTPSMATGMLVWVSQKLSAS